LSHSRKGYSEAVMRQDTETFLRCLENAFRHFGAVPAVLNLDNLKAAVIKADWVPPALNSALAMTQDLRVASLHSEMTFLVGWLRFSHRHQTKDLRASRVFCVAPHD
jgi:hypothetical protein